ncbi:protein-disulfide reductase DsbD [Pontibacter sp. JAM-7]|uniref:protein-disulfide reductase DsbD n=1 Tax=Pontibacter sp. JAM-7 TaxID=3366581 RepID=UPI003AF8A314
MHKRYFQAGWQRYLVIFLLALSLPAMAGLFDNGGLGNDGPLPVDKAYTLNYEQQGDKLLLYWDMPQEYYLYRDRMEFNGLQNSEIVSRTNAPAELKEDPLFGQVWVYHNHAQVELQLQSTTGTPADDVIQVTYQGCWEGGICYPPVTREIVLTQIPVETAPVASASPESLTPQTPVPSVPVTVSEQDQFADMLRNGNLLFTLGAFFVAGLALSFTPCVFPMIPILSSIIIGQGKQITGRWGLVLSLVYVLAVALTYTLAGIFAGMFGENIQALFQNPWIISLFSLVFVLLSLSMFGFYDLQLPASWQTRLSRLSSSQQGGTLTGVFVMGLLSALIVGPCVAAPLAGALIYIGQTADPVLGGAALFSMSMGMGAPLLLIGASAGKLLPHAGLWMEKVKAGFGVALLVLAIWMLDRIVPTAVTMWLLAIVLIVTSVFMGSFHRLDKHDHSLQHIAKGVGLVIFVYGVALMLGALSGGRNLLYPLQGIASVSAQSTSQLAMQKLYTQAELDQALVAAKQAGQPVMLDFYADWCVACVELDTFTFSDPTVQQALSAYKLIKVDVTANDAEAKALSKAYQVIGPPALIFYDGTGSLRPELTVVGVMSPQEFTQHIAVLR